MFCPKCGTPQPEGTPSCVLCGAVIPPPAPRTNPLDPLKTRETKEAETELMVPPSQRPTEEMTRNMGGVSGSRPLGAGEATQIASSPINPLPPENRPYKFPSNPYEAPSAPPPVRPTAPPPIQQPSMPPPQSPFGTPYSTQFPSQVPPPVSNPYAAPPPRQFSAPMTNPANMPGPYGGGAYPNVNPGVPPYGANPGYRPQNNNVSGRALTGLILAIGAFVICLGPLGSIPALILCREEMKAFQRGEANSSSDTCAKVGFWISVINLGLTALWFFGVIVAAIFG